jgi:hypothetical protein
VQRPHRVAGLELGAAQAVQDTQEFLAREPGLLRVDSEPSNWIMSR